jgi:hypothetical protein
MCSLEPIFPYLDMYHAIKSILSEDGIKMYISFF